MRYTPENLRAILDSTAHNMFSLGKTITQKEKELVALRVEYTNHERRHYNAKIRLEEITIIKTRKQGKGYVKRKPASKELDRSKLKAVVRGMSAAEILDLIGG